jgi:hypothetical protein
VGRWRAPKDLPGGGGISPSVISPVPKFRHSYFDKEKHNSAAVLPR